MGGTEELRGRRAGGAIDWRGGEGAERPRPRRGANGLEAPAGPFLKPLVGRAVVLGDYVNTDLIIAGRYCRMADPSALARHVLEGTEWEGKVSPGDVIVAGRGMGTGSSREQAPLALKGAGVSAIAAESFGRIFFRNAINIGLPVMVVPGVGGRVRSGQRVLVDLEQGLLENLTEGLALRGEPLPPFLMEIIRDGGLVPHLRRSLGLRARPGGGATVESPAESRRERRGLAPAARAPGTARAGHGRGSGGA